MDEIGGAPGVVGCYAPEIFVEIAEYHSPKWLLHYGIPRIYGHMSVSRVRLLPEFHEDDV